MSRTRSRRSSRARPMTSPSPSRKISAATKALSPTLMTRRARSLGMNGTTFRNASGLPNPQQITTARDLADPRPRDPGPLPEILQIFRDADLLSSAAARSPNHNHLLGAVEGVDGIKTGYTAASGFNLLTSVRRDGRHIVGVVLGGRSYRQRDQHHGRPDRRQSRRRLRAPHRRRHRRARGRQTRDAQSARVMESAPDEIVETPRRIARVEPRAMIPSPTLAPIRSSDLGAEPRRVNTASLDLSVPLPPAKIETRVGTSAPGLRDRDPRRTRSGRADRTGGTPRRAEGTTARADGLCRDRSTPSSLRWVEGPPGRVSSTHVRGSRKADRTTLGSQAKNDRQAPKRKSRSRRASAPQTRSPLCVPAIPAG